MRETPARLVSSVMVIVDKGFSRISSRRALTIRSLVIWFGVFLSDFFISVSPEDKS